MKNLLMLALVFLNGVILSAQTGTPTFSSDFVCGSSGEIFKPDKNKIYFFTMGEESTVCYGVNIGRVDASSCETFVFESAGLFNGDLSKPLFFIRRTNGDYLSFQMGGAAYVPKNKGIIHYQKWLIRRHPKTGEYILSLPTAANYNFILQRYGDNLMGIGFRDCMVIGTDRTHIIISSKPKYRIKTGAVTN